MVKNVIVEKLNKVKKAVPMIEEKVKIKVSFSGKKIFVKGNEVNEFLAERIIRAIDFGFHPDDAMLLKDEDFVFEIIDISAHTNRKNLKEVRARLIGREGKARQTIETLTGSAIIVTDGQVGVIVDAEHLATTVQAIESLIQGAKHGNVFAYLEKQNVTRGRFGDDLGLKEGAKKFAGEIVEKEE